MCIIGGAVVESATDGTRYEPCGVRGADIGCLYSEPMDPPGTCGRPRGVRAVASPETPMSKCPNSRLDSGRYRITF